MARFLSFRGLQLVGMYGARWQSSSWPFTTTTGNIGCDGEKSACEQSYPQITTHNNREVLVLKIMTNSAKSISNRKRQGARTTSVVSSSRPSKKSNTRTSANVSVASSEMEDIVSQMRRLTDEVKEMRRLTDEVKAMKEIINVTNEKVEILAKTTENTVSRMSEMEHRVVPLEILQKDSRTNGTVSNLTGNGNLSPQQEKDMKTDLRRVLKRDVFETVKFLSTKQAEKLHRKFLHDNIITDDVKPRWLSQEISKLRTNTQANVKNKWKSLMKTGKFQ